MYIGLRVYLYMLSGTSFWGGCIGAGVPLPFFIKRYEQWKNMRIPIKNSRVPIILLLGTSGRLSASPSFTKAKGSIIRKTIPIESAAKLALIILFINVKHLSYV